MRLLLRCDGGPGIGVGHVVRSLALAEEALAHGHEVSVLGQLDGDLLHDLAASLGPRVTLLGGAGGDSDLVRVGMDHDVVHVDHYELEPTLLGAFEAAAAASGRRRPVLSVVADGHFGAQPADVLVDPTVGAELRQPLAPARWHLRGGRFVTLRQAVRQAPPEASASARLHVLVVMGGTDPAACAPRVVAALAHCATAMDVTVVSSPGTAAALAEQAAVWRDGRLYPTPPVSDLPDLMAAADLVISAAGTSTWELCALGRPMALVAVVDNQRPGYDVLVGSGAALGLGTPTDLEDALALADRLRPLVEDPGLRASLARRAHELVDGLGSWRLVRMLEWALEAPPPRGPRSAVEVRPATLEDARLLLAWRNDPVTRAVSRTGTEVALEDHLGWLRSTLERPDRHLLVGLTAGVPVGTVRWDHEDHDEWEVSITVAPGMRGKGTGQALLAAGEEWLFRHLPETPAGLLAVVREDNPASRRLFLGAGYAPDLPPDREGFERWVRSVRRGPT